MITSAVLPFGGVPLHTHKVKLFTDFKSHKAPKKNSTKNAFHGSYVLGASERVVDRSSGIFLDEARSIMQG